MRTVATALVGPVTLLPCMLSQAEISQGPVSSNRIARLCEHLILQQSFYPLFPANGGVSSCEPVPLDMVHSDRYVGVLGLFPADYRWVQSSLICIVFATGRPTGGECRCPRTS